MSVGFLHFPYTSYSFPIIFLLSSFRLFFVCFGLETNIKIMKTADYQMKYVTVADFYIWRNYFVIEHFDLTIGMPTRICGKYLIRWIHLCHYMMYNFLDANELYTDTIFIYLTC